jgi:putative transposase
LRHIWAFWAEILAAANYRELLAGYDIVVRMSGKGDCYANALMQSFFGTVKSECVDRQSYQSREEAR